MCKSIDLRELPLLADKSKSGWLRYYTKNKKRLIKMDSDIHRLHNEISERTDCLQCANCCRTLGPLITSRDVDVMAKSMRMKSSTFIDTYIRVDEDGDMVFQNMPCPFLCDDNYCSIYESRPKACREYPHTDRKNFSQIYKLSVTNASTCPIVYEVLEEINKL